MVQHGDSVEVLIAQSIDEPGTQVTLKTFHGLTETEHNKNIQNFEGCLMSPLSGIIKTEHLSCVCSDDFDMIVTTSECILSILQDDNKIRSYKLSRGTRLLVHDNECVNVGGILCINPVRSNSILVLTNGTIIFECLKYGLNLCKFHNNKSNFVRRYIKTKQLTNKIPLVCLSLGKGIKLCCSSVWDKINFLVKPGLNVRVFDIFFEVVFNYKIHNKITLTEGFKRLSKLFDNSIAEDNSSVICNTDSVLRYGTDGNGNGMVVIDPMRLDEWPLMFSDVNVELFTDDNEVIKQGGIVIPGEIDLSNYAEMCGLNRFNNYFIETVQEIYKEQGVNVNSKHIEMILRQMTNIINISDPGDSTLSINNDYSWQDFARINRYVNLLGERLAVGRRKIVGVTKSCMNKGSILSSISFQGSIKAIIKAIISGNDYRITDIKDGIILGKLPLIGTGFIMNKTQRTHHSDGQ